MSLKKVVKLCGGLTVSAKGKTVKYNGNGKVISPKKKSTRMINTSILDPDAHSLNEFTIALKKKCQAEGSVLVELRNGNYVPVSYYKGDPKDSPDPRFQCFEGDLSFIWELDGISITSTDFDLIEFKS